MGGVYPGRAIPVVYPVTASKSDLDYEGLVLKKNSSANTLELISAKGDTAVAVLDQAFVDGVQAGKTTVAGDQPGVFFLGTGDIVKVACITGITWTTGAIVYLADSVDGAVTTAASTSRPIGHYVGEGTTTTANYDQIEVLLDVAIGAATA